MARIDIRGFYDLHVHTGPAPFERSGDALDIGRWCAAEGMAGYVTKGHFESTIARAHHANRELAAEYPHFRVYAAVACNRGIGGVNPGAVEIALIQGAKVVWLPTLDAANHARAFGGGGTYGFRAMTLSLKEVTAPPRMFSVTDDSGKLTDDAKCVIDLVIAYDAILATGHISNSEIEAVVDYALAKGHRRIVVTHPEFTVPDLDLPSMKALGKEGVFLEFCAGTVFPIVAKVKLEEICAYVREVGVEHCILSSDSGQPFHPRPPEMFRSYLQALHEKGMAEADIRRMCLTNPSFLLGITDTMGAGDTGTSAAAT